MIKNLKSFFTMKRKHCLFIDSVSGDEVFLYIDCFGVEWMASYFWTDRIKRNAS